MELSLKMMKERLEIFREIFPYVSKYKFQWTLLLCLKIGQRLPSLVQPLILRAFIICVIDNKKISYMFIVIAMLIGLYIFETILKVWHRMIDNLLFNKITKDLRNSLFEHYMFVPIEKYNTYKSNDLVRRLDFDVDMVKFFLIGEIFDYISYIVLISVSTVLMFSLDWRLAFMAYILMLFSRKLSKKYEDKIEKNAEQRRELTTQIEESVGRISSFWKEVKANQFESYQEKTFSQVLEKFLNCICEYTEIDFRRKSVLATKENIIDLLGIYVAGGILSLFYHIVAGTVIACIGYYNNILKGFREIIEINAGLSWMKPSISRVIEILNFPLDKNNGNNILHDDRTVYEVKTLWFRYNNSNRDVLQDLSFKIGKGDKILLEGASGIGKSTLLQVLTGELTPTQGQVIFKGINLERVSIREFYHYVRIINQNTYYMNITIREFLKMEKRDVSDDEIKQVCTAVNLWKGLDINNDDLDFFIGENGSNLSKGQRQKLALARLLLCENKIIILDEAFSAIDPGDKMAIIKIILNHFKEQTVICVAHDEEIKRFFHETIQVGKYNITSQNLNE